MARFKVYGDVCGDKCGGGAGDRAGIGVDVESAVSGEELFPGSVFDTDGMPADSGGVFMEDDAAS